MALKNFFKKNYKLYLCYFIYIHTKHISNKNLKNIFNNKNLNINRC